MLGTGERVKCRADANRRAAELAAQAAQLQSEFTFFHDQRRVMSDNESDDAIRKLNLKCEAQASALIAAHGAIPSSDPEEPERGTEPSNIRLSVLLSREQALRAELKQLQAGVTPEDLDLSAKGILGHTMEDVLRGVADIDATIAHLEAQTSENRRLADQEAAVLAERRELESALMQRVKAQPAKRAPTAPRSKQLEASVLQLQQTNKSLMSQLSAFLDRYFPSQEDKSHSVKELLQDLMNRAVTRPDEPWLLLTAHNASPESVELLLRAGIAVKDENDSRRVRLTKFY